ncbi:alpha-amylase family glycosyl hydrolase [Dysgonomonas sp. 511]|uniref:alpha-amylase family glycosyl hydrolase n=1 Tax=Dysgonomonas sp. 511 TaxID=2302930 RepID=UPI0013CFB76F|nr:alpha-amylase family glycosyl hydrolase [Dysgonomonas sp. 511]NDV79199.1 alpha-amylase [Dysgonomonas sp. 511]
MKEKIFIYQVLPRLFGNDKNVNKENGSMEENGVGKFSAFDNKALKEIKKMGFTHIWYTGVLEHASKTDYSAYGIPKDHPDVIKGNAGSPYAIRDYYDVSPDLADNIENRIAEFEALIERTHKNGMKAIMDFVPNHVARQYRSDAKPKKVKDFGAADKMDMAFDPDNNFYYIPGQRLEIDFATHRGDDAYNEFPAKATGNDCFTNRPGVNDWYETVKLNYGLDYNNGRATHFMPEPDTWLKMKDILLYWTAKGVDGFRCDMAEMVPVEFWNWVIPKVKAKNKTLVFIAEVYNPAQYHNYAHCGLFDYLYDKVDLYDTLRDVICDRKPASEITFSWQRIGDLQPKMLNFLENHDEQRIASDFFAGDAAKAMPGMIVAATMNVNPVMVYFGQELGERGMDKEGFSGVDGRTTIFDYWSVDTIRNWRNGGAFGASGLTKEQAELRKFYIRLIEIAKEEEAINSGKFFDLMYANYENPHFDSTKQYAFLRSSKKEFILVVANFDSQVVDITVQIPENAYEYIDINPMRMKTAKELLAKKNFTLKGDWSKALQITMEANSGKIIKFSLD